MMIKIPFIAISLCFLLTSCASTPPAEQVMPPVIYTKPINVHSNKVAYLYWQPGDQHAEVAPPPTVIMPGLVAGLAANIIIQEDHKIILENLFYNLAPLSGHFFY